MNKILKAVATVMVALSTLSFAATPSFSQQAVAVAGALATENAINAELDRVLNSGLTDLQIERAIEGMVSRIGSANEPGKRIIKNLEAFVIRVSTLGLDQIALERVVKNAVSVVTKQVSDEGITAAVAVQFLKSIDQNVSGGVSVGFAEQLRAVISALESGAQTIPQLDASAT